MPTTRATRGPDLTAKQSLRTKHSNYSIPIILSLPTIPRLSSETDGPDGNLASNQDGRCQNAISYWREHKQSHLKFKDPRMDELRNGIWGILIFSGSSSSSTSSIGTASQVA